MSFLPNLTGIFFALTSAAVWGAGDFTGGYATRRANAFQTLALSALSGLVLLVGAARVLRESFPSLRGTLWAMLAGVSGALGIAALYRGLSTGRAASVAPTAAVISAALPVIFGAFSEGLPAPLKLAGFALALGGIWLVSRSPSDSFPVSSERSTDGKRSEDGTLSADRLPFTVRRSHSTFSSIFSPELALACAAGVGFGAFFIFIGLVDRGKILTPLVVTRSVTFLTGLVLLHRSRLPLPRLTAHPLALLAGVLDAGGNLFYILAHQFTRLDIAAVLASLYPASTVLLSGLILKERASAGQWAGVGLCLAAIVLITI